MSIPLLEPSDGLPPLCSTPHSFRHALTELNAGSGPLAIDTERASGFRYGDRAFLIQIRRRGSGTWLFDAEQHRAELGTTLAPVLNSTPWVLHSAINDLPSLFEFGWSPPSLFDTEIAGRLTNFQHVGLAAMVEEVLGLHLAKGLAHSDWSRRPIPDKWLNYAALDVEVLLELAEQMSEILAEEGKTQWAEQEFQHVVRLAQQPRPEPTWRNLKGLHALTQPKQLLIARALWNNREALAERKDLSPGRVLRNQALLQAARTGASSPADLARIPGFPRHRGAAYLWSRVITQALNTPRSTWPDPHETDDTEMVRRGNWQKKHPHAATALHEARQVLAQLSEEHNVPEPNLLATSVLKNVIWHAMVQCDIHTREELAEFLGQEDVRPWQIELLAAPLMEVIQDCGR